MKPPYHWDVWLDYIGQHEVIPILGPELLKVDDNGSMVTLDDWMARRLAAKYGVAWPPCEGAATLNSLVSQILRQSGEPEAIVYSDIRDMVRDGNLRPPEWLRKLARIHDFHLFVTTTFDPLLEIALNEERFHGAPTTRVINNSLRKVGDLPAGPLIPDGATIVHLMGQITTPPFFAVTDNDIIEFLCRLHNENTRPQRLFDALRESHLLLLGGNFPDWVGRLLLRLARCAPLAKRAFPTLDTLADAKALADRELEWFMDHFSKPTAIYPDGDGIAFIDALYERWSARNAASTAVEPVAPAQPAAPERPCAVFLSYAREDQDAVRILKKCLEDHGLDVWLDEDRLNGGDFFEAKIYDQVDHCALFVPVISIQTEARLEGFFRREWKRAIYRLPAIFAGKPFIIPVTIDATNAGNARSVPVEFRPCEWTSCPGGTPPEDFANRLSSLLCSPIRSQ